MTEKITENISLWDILKKSAKPIFLYGMGNGADKIIDCCRANDIKIQGIFASDEFVRGHFFRGYKIKKLSEIQNDFDDFIIIVAFAAHDRQITDRIRELDQKYELYAPDMPVFGSGSSNGYYNYFMENIDNFSHVYNLLADDKSRQVYTNAINFKISGKIKYLFDSDTPKTEALSLLNLAENRKLLYVDLGAYDGDTIFELDKYLKSVGKSIDEVIAVEPDRKNFAKLQKNLAHGNFIEKYTVYNIGIWSERQDIYFNEKAGRHSSVSVSEIPGKKISKITADSVDNIINCGDEWQYFIKYDVEGSEYEAIIGSANTIKKYSPAMSVSLYHRHEDLLKLPLLINKLNPSYKFYLRKHEYIPCWDLNLYVQSKR